MAETPGPVWISEVLANPLGSDTGHEWVELANVSAQPLNAGGLKVVRGSGATVLTVPANTVIPPFGVLQVPSTSLLNSGDTLTLFTDTTELDKITYDATGSEGWSWSRVDAESDSWTADTTPGHANIVIVGTPTATPSPTGSPSPSPTPVATPLPTGPALPLYGDIWINELLANPTGSDTDQEWIELRNLTEHDLSIGDLRVVRESNSLLLNVPDGTVLPANGFAAFEELSGSLVNSGDGLRLEAAALVLDSISYDAEGEEGYSWNRVDLTLGAWSSLPTPGQPNALVEAAVETEPVTPGTDATLVPAATKALTAPATTKKAATTKKKTAAKKSTKKAASKAGKLPSSGPATLVYLAPLAGLTWYGYRRWKRR